MCNMSIEHSVSTRLKHPTLLLHTSADGNCIATMSVRTPVSATWNSGWKNASVWESRSESSAGGYVSTFAHTFSCHNPNIKGDSDRPGSPTSATVANGQTCTSMPEGNLHRRVKVYDDFRFL